MFYFDGKEFASFLENNEDDHDTLLIAMEYDKKEIKEFKEVLHGYYDITFDDGMIINAVSHIHIKRSAI